MHQILEELRLNIDDLHELAKQAVERARRRGAEARATRLRLERALAINAPKKT